MKLINKLTDLIKNQPFGCLFAAILSLLMLTLAIGGMIFTFYAIASVSLIKDSVSEKTGFHMSASNIFVNAFTGYCRIDNMTLENPAVYDYSENNEKIRKFILAKKVEMQLSPVELLSGKFRISSFKIDIEQLNCVRVNNSTFNLPEFLNKATAIFSIDDSNSKNTIDEIFIEINSVAYNDASTQNDTFNWNDKINFIFQRKNLQDSKLLDELISALDKSNLTFIVEGLKRCHIK